MPAARMFGASLPGSSIVPFSRDLHGGKEQVPVLLRPRPGFTADGARAVTLLTWSLPHASSASLPCDFKDHDGKQPGSSHDSGAGRNRKPR